MKTPLGLFHFSCQNDLSTNFELAEPHTGAQNHEDMGMEQDTDGHPVGSSHHTSQDSRIIDAARVASLLLSQRETEFIDPYTVHDPMFEAIIHDLLILATMMGEDADEIMANSRRWYQDTMKDVWEEEITECWAERRRKWAVEVASDFHRLYMDRKDPLHLMACFARLANPEKKVNQPQDFQG